MISEPLETGIANDIEAGRVNMRMTNKERGKFFESKYQWDLLASRNIWAFGPEENGANVLINDTLPSEVSCFTLSVAQILTLLPCQGRHEIAWQCAGVNQTGLPVGNTGRTLM